MTISESIPVAKGMSHTDYPEVVHSSTPSWWKGWGGWRESGDMGLAQPKPHQLRAGQGNPQREARVLLLEEEEMPPGQTTGEIQYHFQFISRIC